MAPTLICTQILWIRQLTSCTHMYGFDNELSTTAFARLLCLSVSIVHQSFTHFYGIIEKACAALVIEIMFSLLSRGNKVWVRKCCT